MSNNPVIRIYQSAIDNIITVYRLNNAHTYKFIGYYSQARLTKATNDPAKFTRDYMQGTFDIRPAKG